MAMPPGVQEFANWLPLTHVVHLLQDIWLDGAWNNLSGLILLGVPPHCKKHPVRKPEQGTLAPLSLLFSTLPFAASFP